MSANPKSDSVKTASSAINCAMCSFASNFGIYQKDDRFVHLAVAALRCTLVQKYSQRWCTCFSHFGDVCFHYLSIITLYLKLVTIIFPCRNIIELCKRMTKKVHLIDHNWKMTHKISLCQILFEHRLF